MKKKTIGAMMTVMAVVGCLLLASCTAGTSVGSSSSSMESGSGSASSSLSSDSKGYATISTDDAKRLIDEGDVTIVDVRTQSEYEQGHIPGAVLVTLDTIGDTLPASLPDKDATLLVYCRTGVRSTQASTALVDLGYTRINNMNGGITAWKYETVTGA